MKLAVICMNYPAVGPAGARLVRLIKPMSKTNEIHLFVYGTTILKNEDYKDEYFKIHKIVLPGKRSSTKYLFSKFGEKKLYERMKKYGEFDAIFSYQLSPLAHVSSQMSKKFSIPLFSDYADLELWEYMPAPYLVKMLYIKIMINSLKKVFKNANHIFPITTFLKNRLIEFYGVSDDKITVIPNGVDTNFFIPRNDGIEIKRNLNLSDSFVIGYSGGAIGDWIKLDLLFEAFKNLRTDYKDIKLLIVGGINPQEVAKWQKISKKIGIEDDITFTGLIPHEAIPKYIASFDIAVSTFTRSLYTEAASPLKVAEYMGMGKAIVADDSSGTKELIDHMNNGILFESENLKSMEKSLRIILDDKKIKIKFEKNARKTSLKYDWQKLSKQFENIITNEINRLKNESFKSNKLK